MAKYQVAVLARPEGWTPATPDDVPPEPGKPVETLGESDDLFAAVRQAIDYNQQSGEGQGWAVVAEPGTRGRICPEARLCTPISYQVATIAWPDAWEPMSPVDVPNCVLQLTLQDAPTRQTYDQVATSVRALNQQCIDQPGATWYVVIAVENEPVSQTSATDADGAETTTEQRRLHVIRPESGGRGDCSHCPAHDFECAKADWSSQQQTITVSRTPPAG